MQAEQTPESRHAQVDNSIEAETMLGIARLRWVGEVTLSPLISGDMTRFIGQREGVSQLLKCFLSMHA